MAFGNKEAAPRQIPVELEVPGWRIPKTTILLWAAMTLGLCGLLALPFLPWPATQAKAVVQHMPAPVTGVGGAAPGQVVNRDVRTDIWGRPDTIIVEYSDGSSQVTQCNYQGPLNPRSVTKSERGPVRPYWESLGPCREN